MSENPESEGLSATEKTSQAASGKDLSANESLQGGGSAKDSQDSKGNGKKEELKKGGTERGSGEENTKATEEGDPDNSESLVTGPPVDLSSLKGGSVLDMLEKDRAKKEPQGARDLNLTGDLETDREELNRLMSTTGQGGDNGSKDKNDDTIDGKNTNKVPAPYKEKLPPVEKVDIEVQSDAVVTSVGVVSAKVDLRIVVKGHAQENSQAVDLDTLLVTAKREPIGVVDEVFGPVKEPFYVIRFNSEQDLNDCPIQKGDQAYFVAGMAKFVLAANLDSRGTDASTINDQEVTNPREMDFSDDEEEKLSKAKMKGKKAKKNPAPPSAEKKTKKVKKPSAKPKPKAKAKPKSMPKPKGSRQRGDLLKPRAKFRKIFPGRGFHTRGRRGGRGRVFGRGRQNWSIPTQGQNWGQNYGVAGFANMAAWSGSYYPQQQYGQGGMNPQQMQQGGMNQPQMQQGNINRQQMQQGSVNPQQMQQGSVNPQQMQQGSVNPQQMQQGYYGQQMQAYGNTDQGYAYYGQQMQAYGNTGQDASANTRVAGYMGQEFVQQ